MRKRTLQGQFSRQKWQTTRSLALTVEKKSFSEKISVYSPWPREIQRLRFSAIFFICWSLLSLSTSRSSRSRRSSAEISSSSLSSMAFATVSTCFSIICATPTPTPSNQPHKHRYRDRERERERDIPLELQGAPLLEIGQDLSLDTIGILKMLSGCMYVEGE